MRRWRERAERVVAQAAGDSHGSDPISGQALARVMSKLHTFVQNL